MTLLATAALAAAVLFRSHDYRISVGVIVCLAALTLVVRSLSTGKFVLAVLFLGVLGVFTPFRSSQFSTLLVSVLDLATLTGGVVVALGRNIAGVMSNNDELVKQLDDLTTLTGAEVEKQIREVMNQPREVIERVKKLTE